MKRAEQLIMMVVWVAAALLMINTAPAFWSIGVFIFVTAAIVGRCIQHGEADIK